MVKHYNPSIVQDALRILNTKTNNLSDEVGDLVPTIPITPICRVVKTNSSTASGSSITVYTTPSDKDFYLTGLVFTYQKDATCDCADGTHAAIQTTIEGLAIQLIRSTLITLSADSRTFVNHFTTPVKIDRGVTIIITVNTFTVGKFVRSATIYGYTQETTAN